MTSRRSSTSSSSANATRSCPFSRLQSLQDFFDRQDERVEQVALDGSSPLLPARPRCATAPWRRLDGTIESDGTRYLYAARLVRGKGFVLLRPASSTNSAWRPQVQGLIVAAIVDVRARGPDRVPARAGDRQARPARRRGDPRPCELDRATAARARRGPARARAAGGELQRAGRRARRRRGKPSERSSSPSATS